MGTEKYPSNNANIQVTTGGSFGSMADPEGVLSASSSTAS